MLTNEQEAEIARLYLEEMISVNRIADSLNLDRNLIRNTLFRQGVQMRTNKNSKLTAKQEQEIVELYLAGRTSEELTALYPVKSKQSISNVLIKHRVPRRANEDYKRTRYLNEQAFDVIDSEAASYWLGFLYADGYSNARIGRFEVGLSIVDYGHLEKLSSFLSSGYPLELRNRADGKGDRVVRLNASSKYLTARLAELGIIPYRNQFHLTFAALPPHLYRHFLRGFFDGDGWYFIIDWETWKDVIIGICGQDDVLFFVREVLASEAGTNPNVKIGHMQGINKITYSGVPQAKRIIHYLYQDATVYLERKAKTIQEILTIYPHPKNPKK